MNANNYLGFSPELRGYLNSINLGLPPIRGKWFVVDPYGATVPAVGGQPGQVVADLETAYDLCTSGAGDGILVLSGGTTAAHTTSYLSSPLTWSKHGITVVGASSGSRLFNRARIANKTHTTGSITTLAFVAGADTTYDSITDSAEGFVTAGFAVGDVLRVDTTGNGADATGLVITAVTAGTLTLATIGTLVTETAANAGASVVSSYNANMITVSGDNNSFSNLSISNFGDDALALGGVSVTGNRNHFSNCHIVGAGNATPGAVTSAYSLKIDGGQENTFDACVIGTDSVLKAAANGEIAFDGDAWRNRFYDCEVVSYSETAGKGAIISADATAFDGWQVFSRCRFMNFYTNGITGLTSAFIGTAPNSGYLLMDSCSLAGWSAWDSVGGNDTVYVSNSDATASGAGGIATTI